MRTYLILGLLLISTLSCQEDTIEPAVFGSIVGEVLEENTNVGVVDATISTNPATNTIFTDSLGRFALENVKVGTYTIRTVKRGYNTELQTVTVNRDKSTNVIIRLLSDSLNNTPPTQPFNPMPANGVDNQSINLTLSWEATDEDEQDELKYDVTLYKANQTTGSIIASNILQSSTKVEQLDYNTTYYWQVTVKDRTAEIHSPVWSFKTKPFPNHPYLFARKKNGKYDIYSANTAGEQIQLTDNNASNWRPKMNPSRTKIAYISNVGAENHIYIMNRDGSNSFQVTTVPIIGFDNLELDFSWSPDGTQLLYMNHGRLIRINTDGSGFQVLREFAGFSFTEVDWTAQQNRILYRLTGSNFYKSFIYLWNQSDAPKQLITDEPGGLGGPVFSVSGKEMLYTKDIEGFEDFQGRQLNSHIFIKSLENPNLPDQDISENKPAGTNDTDARFSADGAFIIFVNSSNIPGSTKNVWLMDRDGENRTLLFENAEMPTMN